MLQWSYHMKTEIIPYATIILIQSSEFFSNGSVIDGRIVNLSISKDENHPMF